MKSRLPLIDLTVLDMVDVAQEMEYGPNRPHWTVLPVQPVIPFPV